MKILQKEPLVYIILVNYRTVNDTIECVESLKQIKYKNYNIVVVDNYSNDGSLEKLEECTGIKVIESRENKGFAGGNNIAIEYALKNKAEYILLLNNDTTVDPDFLSELIRNDSEEVGILTGKILFYTDRNMLWYAGGQISKIKGTTEVNGYKIDKGQYNENKYVTFASGCCMLIKRNLIEKIGLLKEDYFLYFEDSDYCARVQKSGYKIKYCAKSIIYHKVSTSTGKYSYNYLYYFTRNRLLFINDNLEGIYKISAYIYSLIFIFIKSVIRKQNKIPICKGICHFLIGKREMIK